MWKHTLFLWKHTLFCLWEGSDFRFSLCGSILCFVFEKVQSLEEQPLCAIQFLNRLINGVLQSKLGLAVETCQGLQNVVGSVKGFLSAQKWGVMDACFGILALEQHWVFLFVLWNSGVLWKGNRDGFEDSVTGVGKGAPVTGMGKGAAGYSGIKSTPL